MNKLTQKTRGGSMVKAMRAMRNFLTSRTLPTVKHIYVLVTEDNKIQFWVNENGKLKEETPQEGDCLKMGKMVDKGKMVVEDTSKPIDNVECLTAFMQQKGDTNSRHYKLLFGEYMVFTKTNQLEKHEYSDAYIIFKISHVDKAEVIDTKGSVDDVPNSVFQITLQDKRVLTFSISNEGNDGNTTSAKEWVDEIEINRLKQFSAYMRHLIPDPSADPTNPHKKYKVLYRDRLFRLNRQHMIVVRNKDIAYIFKITDVKLANKITYSQVADETSEHPDKDDAFKVTLNNDQVLYFFISQDIDGSKISAQEWVNEINRLSEQSQQSSGSDHELLPDT
jgi:hypothetical protein